MGNKIAIAARTGAGIAGGAAAKPGNLRFFKGGLHEDRVSRTSENSLKHYENISKEVLDVIREHGLKDVPSSSFFKKIGRSDIVSAANVYYGGIFGVRAEMISKGDLKLE